MLTERQMLILQEIVDEVSKSGEPLGSKTLADREKIKASSATIRNEMARLESMGFIAKTHSSSGRVPTEKGYRYYINQIMPRYGGVIDTGLDEEQQHLLREVFDQPYLELSDVLQKSTQFLADLTNYVAITVGPSVSDYHLEKIQIIPITTSRVMIVIVTVEGKVIDQLFLIPDSLMVDALQRMAKWVNDALSGSPLLEVVQYLQSDLISELDSPVQDFVKREHVIEYLINRIDRERVFIKGRSNLLQSLSEKREFDQVDRVNALLDDPDRLSRALLLHNTGINVLVGDELWDDSMISLSLVTASLGHRGQHRVMFALLGSGSMSYVQMARLIQGVRVELNHYLDDYYNK